MVKTISILGATGSIGQSVRAVISQKPELFEVDALVGGSDVDGLASLAIELRAKHAVIADETRYNDLKSKLSGTKITVAAGEKAVIEAAQRPVDIVVSAITGIAGLAPTYAAICAGQTVALANKEALVCAGDMLMQAAKRAGATLLPLDSEHNALFQALNGKDASSIERMVLTASGGPFVNWPIERIENATKDEALAHPNWSMGQKITIDSASMMNKGLELIEAHYLFGVTPEKLGVLVHPQSIIHGLIFHKDGSVIAGMAMPDMKIPVAYCLGFPERLTINLPRLDLAAIGTLSFFEPDRARFACLRLAEQAMKQGGALPTVLNCANEVAVDAFLQGQIKFGSIARIVEHTLEQYSAAKSQNVTPICVSDVQNINLISRQLAQKTLFNL
jgi:1-deoxy-D-xylulose-5-phosphate reductoisomerase